MPSFSHYQFFSIHTKPPLSPLNCHSSTIRERWCFPKRPQSAFNSGGNFHCCSVWPLNFDQSTRTATCALGRGAQCYLTIEYSSQHMQRSSIQAGCLYEVAGIAWSGWLQLSRGVHARSSFEHTADCDTGIFSTFVLTKALNIINLFVCKVISIQFYTQNNYFFYFEGQQTIIF